MSEARPIYNNNAQRPTALEDGDAVNVVTFGCRYLTVIPGAGATITVSRIDSYQAGSHGTPAATGTDTETIDVDWAYYRISTAGGDARFCLGG